MKTNLEKLLSLSNIYRFNTKLRISSESVAEHSFYVALLSMIICDYISSNSILNINKLKVLCIALVHDLPESITGDVTYDVKTSMPEINNLLNHYEKDSFNNVVNTKYYNEYAEKISDESIIVHFSDILSVSFYSQKEISLGNKNFEIILDHNYKRLNEFINSIKNFELKQLLKNLVDNNFNHLDSFI